MKKNISACLLAVSIIFIFPLSLTAQSAPKKSTSSHELLEKGENAFYNYNFDEAENYLRQYRSALSKNKQNVPEELERLESGLEIARKALERVQKLVVIDSIEVDRKEFYKAYKLSTSAGNIGGIDIFPGGVAHDKEETGYLSEGKDYALTVTANDDGNLSIIENLILTDGSIESIDLFKDYDWANGDFAFPFMLQDGQTLYFANNGEESMGGYDLFIAKKDPVTGEFLQPLNLGMPFNSPYDDIMLAIDEERGLGWWATDRHSDGDKITVYVYILTDTRENYDEDFPNIESIAFIDNYKSTWEAGKENEYRSLLNFATNNKKVKKNDGFSLEMGNGKIYTAYNDFRNKESKELMKKYLQEEKQLSIKEEKLEELRAKYSGNASMSPSILKEEEQIENLREELKAMKNEIIKMENSAR